MAAKKSKKDSMQSIRNLNRDLGAGVFERVYLFYGSEPYLYTQCRDNVKKALIAEGDTMNFARFDGENIDEKALMDLADTMPFFSEHRLIAVDDSGFFSSSHEALAEYLSHIPETTSLVFTESKVDSRTKTFKAAAKAGLALELDIPKSRDLVTWLAVMAKRDGKKVSQSTLEHFLSITEQDMFSMKNEMTKVLDYVGERDFISREDVDAVCTVSPQDRIFSMIDALAQKDVKGALKLYNDLVALRTPPMVIIFNINRLFARLYQIKDLIVKGYPVDTISGMTGISSFKVRKDAGLSARFDLAQLRAAIEKGAWYEEAVKTGRMTDTLAAELMITSCGGI